MTLRRDTTSKRAKPWSRTKLKRRELAPDVEWALEIERKVTAGLHPWQVDAVQDPARRITFLCGRGAGKTTTAIARALVKCTRKRKAKIVYVATTRNHAEELAWGPLKDACEALGLRTDGADPDVSFNETKLRATFHRTGSTYRLVGADDKREIEKLRGQPFDEVQVDEGASHLPELLEWLLFRIIGPRLGERDGCIVLFGTPGHILRGPFFDATRPGSDVHRPYRDRKKPEFKDWKGWSSHAWTARDVFELKDARKRWPRIVKNWEEALVEKAANRWSDDHPVWVREYLAQWVADDTANIFRYRPLLEDGTPFNQWDPLAGRQLEGAAAIAAAVAKLPPELGNWAFVYAMDEGLKDPFACNVFAFSPDDQLRRIWHVFGFERPKMYAQPIAHLLLGEQLDHEHPAGLFGVTGWPDGTIGDFGNALIEELKNVYGIHVVQSDRSHKYKFAAIEVCNGDFIDGRIFILKGSVLEQQLMTLQWVTDEFGGVKENKAQANHSSDTLIIGRKLIGTLITASPPSVDTVPRDGSSLATPIDAASEPREPTEASRRRRYTEDEDPYEAREEFSSWIRGGSYDDPWG